MDHRNRLIIQTQMSKRNANVGISSNDEFEAQNMEDDHNAIALSVQRYSIFNQQNVETGHFDVTFVFNEKELHAYSFVLWSASEVFETMLFGAWAKKEPIPITGHSYENFKEFLTFFYLGKCTITMDNIMVLVDLAEAYNVQLLKDKCDHFLTNITPTAENVFKICETLKIYSLQNSLDNLYEFVLTNAATLLKTPTFLTTPKEIVLDIVKMERLVIREEDLFEAVYKWAEYQHQKQDSEKPASIKDLLSDILPHIRFPVMDIDYLHGNVVPLGGLFSSFNELSQILKDAGNFKKKTLAQPLSKYRQTVRNGFNVVITDNQGNIAHTYIHDKNIFEKLATLYQNQNGICTSINNGPSHGYGVRECYWNIEISKPLTQDKNILDFSSCQLYIIRTQKGVLGLKKFPPPENERIQNPKILPLTPGFIYRHLTNGLDIIARVYPENSKFLVGQGSTLKILSENGIPSIDDEDNYQDVVGLADKAEDMEDLFYD